MQVTPSFAKKSRIFPRFLYHATQVSIGILVCVGCGQEPMPKGTGASGSITGVLEEPDAGLDLINRLSPAQQKAFDFMHHPWEKAVVGVAESVSPENAALVEKVKIGWDSFPFARQGKDDRRFDDFAQIVTSVGSFVLEFGDDFSPDHIRSLALLVENKRFDNVPLVEVDGVAMLGRATEHLYWLEPLCFRLVPTKGSLIMIKNSDNRVSATEIGICLEDQPKLKDRATILGGLVSPDDLVVIDKIRDALAEKPESVLLERIEWSRRQGPLFQTSGARLPRMTESGSADGLQASRETVPGMQMSVGYRSQPGARFPTPEEHKLYPSPTPVTPATSPGTGDDENEKPTIP